MSAKSIFVYLTSLQIVIAFGATPIVVLNKFFGSQAVLVYSLSSIVMIAGITAWLTWKGRVPGREAELSALTFGLVFTFILAEFVALILVVHK